MQLEDQTISTCKLVIELEVTGDDEQFALLKRLCDGYVNGVRQVAQVTKITQRVSCTAYFQPPLSLLTHNDVQLPEFKSNGVAKQPVVKR